MEKRGFEHCITRWVMAMLDSREVLAELGGTSVTVKTTRGCPQGGVLSPLLWSLVVDDLLKKLSELGFEVIGFADDVVILVRGKFEEIITERMQYALNFTFEWCKNEGLNINPKKTVVVPFTRKRKILLKTLTLDGSALEFSKNVKYLGIILDAKLNWNLHLDQAVQKATTALWVSRKTFGMKWGLKPKMISWIYSAIIRPRLTYAALVWWPKTKQKTAQKKLEKLQRLICISITGAMRSTPTNALNAALHLLPLYQYVQMEAGKSALRLRRTENLFKNSLIEHLGILKELNIDPHVFMNEDWMEYTLNLDITYKVILTDRQVWESGGPSLPPGAIIFYTDGSKMGNKTGAGITGPGLSISAPMGRWTTVFLAEIYAILECASACLKRNYRHSTICIFSDSQAALNALNSSKCQSRLVWECVILLKKLGNINRVFLYWVPGHCGVEGNEKADFLARKGSDDLFAGPEPFCGVSKCVLKMEITKWENSMIQQNWISSKSAKQSKLFITPSKQKTSRILGLNKRSLNIYIGLITGHCPSRYHLKKLTRSQTDICRLCDCEVETSKHLLCECGALISKRIKFFNKGTLTPSEIYLENPTSVVDFILEAMPNWGISHPQSVAVTLNGDSSP